MVKNKDKLSTCQIGQIVDRLWYISKYAVTIFPDVHNPYLQTCTNNILHGIYGRTVTFEN